MIADADRSLANFLTAALGRGATVVFDAPTDPSSTTTAAAARASTSGSASKPTSKAAPARPIVSCFLHRVVEDVARRGADFIELRGTDGRVDGRQPPVRHYRLEYMVSALADSIADEHRVLGDVLTACVASPIVDATHRAGVLADEPEPVLVEAAHPVSSSPTSHEIWASLGVPLRASLRVVLTVPLRLPVDAQIAPPAEHLAVEMESIGAGDAATASTLASRRWTTVRIHERSAGMQADDR